MNALLISVVITATFATGAETAWHHPLCYDGDGYWHVRVPVDVHNALANALDGAPAEIVITNQDGTAALAGCSLASLRVVTEKGTELILGVADGNGQAKFSGNLSQGDRISVPIEAKGDETVRVYLYADNPGAWLPPERFTASLANTSFEEGDVYPLYWRVEGTDTTHRMSLDRKTVHAGTTAARCDVDAGAAPAWVKYVQGGLPVAHGAGQPGSPRGDC